MLLCFLGAVYYFLDYLTKNSKMKLILSYSLLVLSFLFLQKIVLLGFGFIVVNLYYLHSKQIRLPDFVLAVVCAMSPLILFFSYLLYNEVADDWFYYNFTFNMLLKKYYDGYTSGFGFLSPIWFLGSFFIVLRYYKWEKSHILIAVLYFLSVVTTVLIAPHAQYFVLYFIFASIFLGNILLNAKYFKLLCLSLMLFSFIAFFTMLPSEKSKIGYLKHFGDISATLKYADANKSVLSLNKVSCNLFNQSPFYYWFGFHNVAIIDAIYNPQKKFDLMSELKKKPADFICYEKSAMLPILNDMVIFDKSKYFIRRNSAIITKSAKIPDFLKRLIIVDSDFWQIDEEWIEQNYDQIEGTVIWKKKM